MLKGILNDKSSLAGKTTYYRSVFYPMMALSVAVLFITLLATRGESARWFLFIGWSENNGDSFMDFFNSVVNTHQNPYDVKVIYPAICSVIHKLLYFMIRPVDFGGSVTDPTSPAQPTDIKLYQSFMLTYIIFTLAFFVLFFFALNALMRKSGNGEKSMMAFFCLLSAPFLFLIDRGNIMGFSLAFAMLFVAYYDDERRLIRELAFICLAFSISIKIYPAVFAVLLLNEKRYKDFIKTVIYTVIVFFLPFIFFGGVSGAVKFVKNLFSTSANSFLSIDLQLSFQKFPVYIGYIFGSESNVWAVIGVVMMILFAVLGFFCSLISKKRWKTCAICTCLLVGVPAMSARYALMFFIIPIILMFMEEKENNWFSYLSLVIMGAMMFVKPLLFWGLSENSRYFGYKVDSFLYIGFFVILCVDAIVQLVRNKRPAAEKSREVA